MFTKNNNALNYAVNYGNLKRVRELINQHGLHHTEAHGYVLLRESSKRRYKEITKLLLNSGSRVNNKRCKTIASNTPLHFAIENGDLEITQMLLDHGADINAPNENGSSPLLIAIHKKYEIIVDLLLKRGPILYSCNKGLSPLHVAVENRLCNVTGQLLKAGSLVNAQVTHCNYRKEYTPLHFATNNGDFAIVEVLLKNGAIVSSKTAQGLTPIHLACQQGNVRIIELLLNSNADINARTNNSFTPLYLAVENSHREAAELLMDRGAKIDDEFENGKTILSCAVDRGLSIIVDDILQHRPDINNAINKNSLKIAARKSDTNYLPIVKNLLRYGFSVEPGDINDTALLHNAIQMGYTEIIQDLIKYGLNLTCSNEENRNILHIAEKYKQFEIAKLLLTYGADVNATDETGKPPIYYSTQNSDVNMTKLLLLYGADVQKSPELLVIATTKNCKEIVEILLENKADTEARDGYDRMTALHLAASWEYNRNLDSLEKNEKVEIIKTKAEITKMFLIMGAKVNAKTSWEETALHIACGNEFKNVVEVLLEYQADVGSPSKRGTPLHFATSMGNATIIGLLLQKRANINAKRENSGDTALHIAAEIGYTEALKILLKNGADVGLKNNSFETPLHLASQRTNPEASPDIVALLLEHMSPVNAQNKDGNTALHVAIDFEITDIIQKLLDFGSQINILNNNYFTPIDLQANRFRYYENFESEDEELDHLERDLYDRYSDCHYTYYRNSKNALRVLLLHAITLKTANLCTVKKYLYSYLYDDDNSLLKIKEEECKNEIEDLKSNKIENNKLSFYDILTKSIYSLTKYTRNKDVIRIFESDFYKTKFPIYAPFIEKNFKKASQRRQLLEKAQGFFEFYFEIPYECADQIIYYLSDADLKNFTN